MSRPKGGCRVCASLASLAVAIAAGALASCGARDGANRIAFVYGISVYRDDLAEGDRPNLDYCDDDAFGMAELLSASGYEVRSRISGAAGDTPETYPTRARILEDIASVTSETDRVVFYFSGHGFRNDYGESAEDYIVPYGALVAGVGIVESEFIGASEWQALMAACSAPQKICIFDSCYSGGFVYTEGELDLCPPIFGPEDEYGQEATPGILDPSLLSPVFMRFMAGRDNPSDALVISAAGSMERSYEEAGHGVFTKALLDSVTPYPGYPAGFARADKDLDGVISAIEAFSYAALAVDTVWNHSAYGSFMEEGIYADYYPHVSSGSLDAILFTY